MADAISEDDYKKQLNAIYATAMHPLAQGASNDDIMHIYNSRKAMGTSDDDLWKNMSSWHGATKDQLIGEDNQPMKTYKEEADEFRNSIKDNFANSGYNKDDLGDIELMKAIDYSKPELGVKNDWAQDYTKPVLEKLENNYKNSDEYKKTQDQLYHEALKGSQKIDERNPYWEMIKDQANSDWGQTMWHNLWSADTTAADPLNNAKFLEENTGNVYRNNQTGDIEFRPGAADSIDETTQLQLQQDNPDIMDSWSKAMNSYNNKTVQDANGNFVKAYTQLDASNPEDRKLIDEKLRQEQAKAAEDTKNPLNLGVQAGGNLVSSFLTSPLSLIKDIGNLGFDARDIAYSGKGPVSTAERWGQFAGDLGETGMDAFMTADLLAGPEAWGLGAGLRLMRAAKAVSKIGEGSKALSTAANLGKWVAVPGAAEALQNALSHGSPGANESTRKLLDNPNADIGLLQTSLYNSGANPELVNLALTEAMSAGGDKLGEDVKSKPFMQDFEKDTSVSKEDAQRLQSEKLEAILENPEAAKTFRDSLANTDLLKPQNEASVKTIKANHEEGLAKYLSMPYANEILQSAFMGSGHLRPIHNTVGRIPVFKRWSQNAK